tara:strand:+ start:388 stop:1473 length:1086 start_codon:yes stop_codon:yes gene_type:complete
LTRILFIIGSLGAGGKERRALSLLKKLKNHDSFHVELILLKNEVHYTEVFDYKIKTHIIDRNFLSHFGVVNRIIQINKFFNPDIIHAWDTLSTLYAVPIKFFNKVKLISSKITDAPPNYKKISYYGFLSELCFIFSDIILSNSYAGINAYRVSKNKSRVIYNGFDFNRLKNLKSPEIIRNKYEISEKYLVIMIASFSVRKDFRTFLNAATKIRNEQKEIGFICVGDGKLRKQLKDEFNDHGIYFLGKLNDVESLINICDLGVLLTNSRIHGEGISNSLLELMALNKPVIASNNGGNSELIENNKSGTILKDGKVSTLVDTIMLHYNNQPHYKSIGTSAKNRVIKKFSMKLMFDKFMYIYNK